VTRVIDRGTSQAKSMYIGSAIDDAGLDPYEFRIYCHLKRRAQDGVVWERQDRMADICRMSRKTVNEVLSRLEEKGWVEQRQRTLKGQQSSNLVYLLEPPCNPELHGCVTHGYTAVSPTVTAEGTPLEGTPLEGFKDGAKSRAGRSEPVSEAAGHSLPPIRQTTIPSDTAGITPRTPAREDVPAGLRAVPGFEATALPPSAVSWPSSPAWLIRWPP
jgi:Helix-turn-helix domain